MDILLDEVALENTGQVVELTEAPQTLDQLGITPQALARFIRFYYDPGAIDVVARYSHDQQFTPTADAGIPVAPLDVHFLNDHMFLSTKIRAVSGTLNVYIEQFALS